MAGRSVLVNSLCFIKHDWKANVTSKTKAHLLVFSNEDKSDFRLVFEIERVGQLFDDYKKVKLEIWRTFTDTTLKSIIPDFDNASPTSHAYA